MKILVTGGSSTLGKHLQKLEPSAVYVSSAHCDLTNYDATIKLMEEHQPDIVIHLAALVGGIKDNIKNPVDYLEQNILINTNTIKAAFAVGVRRLIAVSSTCIYPDVVAEYPMIESDVFRGPPTPTNFEYAYSKRCMIAQLEAYNKQYKTEYCYITPSNLYSELDAHKHDRAHYITALLDKIQQAECVGESTIKLLGTGKPLRQFTYAEDVAQIILLMIKYNVYSSFNVSNPETYSIDKLASITLQSLNKVDWNIEYSNPELDGQYRKDVSIAKLKKLFPEFIFTPFAIGIKKVYIEKIKQQNG